MEATVYKPDICERLPEIGEFVDIYYLIKTTNKYVSIHGQSFVETPTMTFKLTEPFGRGYLRIE